MIRYIIAKIYTIALINFILQESSTIELREEKSEQTNEGKLCCCCAIIKSCFFVINREMLS